MSTLGLTVDHPAGNLASVGQLHGDPALSGNHVIIRDESLDFVVPES
jgi:hypothetical protein